MPSRKPARPAFSRLEREIMDALYRLGEAGTARVADELGQEDAYESIRVTLATLVKKGHVRTRREGNRNVYAPVVPPARARRSALRHVLHTFFEGSPSKAIVTLLDSGKLSEDELREIAGLLKKKERGS